MKKIRFIFQLMDKVITSKKKFQFTRQEREYFSHFISTIDEKITESFSHGRQCTF